MDCETLSSLFISDLSKAIDESKKMICSISKFESFQDFTSYHLNNPRFYYCPKPFSAKFIPQMSIYCLDCGIKKDSLNLMCLSCFLNGNHEGHNYFIFPGFMGNCDCGDESRLKCSGFCSSHPGLENDENLDNYLDENLRSILTNTIFTAAIKAILHFQPTDAQKLTQIGDFLISFFNLGDGFRRLFIRALIQNDLLNRLLSDVQDSPSTTILTIFSYLMHDKLFMRNFSEVVISLVSNKAIKNSSEYMLRPGNTISPNYSIWYNFIYTCFSEQFCRYNIEKNNWDWISFSLELITQYKKLLVFFKSYKYNTFPLVFSLIKFIHFATSIQPNEKTQEFFDKLFTQVLNTGVNEANDTVIIDSYNKFAISIQIDSYYDFLQFFGELMISFKSKENLKFDKLIEELEKSIDIAPLFTITKNSVGEESGKNNENDKLISRFIVKKDESKATKSFFDVFKSTMKNIFDSFPSKYYKSFYNGASFHLCHPLFDSFAMLLRVDDLCRIKLARFLCQERYQPLRVKLGIVTLKKLLSVICFKMGLVRFKNFSILILFDKIFDDKKEITNNMIPISVLQLLIGLQCNDKPQNNDIFIDDEFILKEFFSFELAREIGVFENKTSKLKDLMIFTFLYVSLMLVIDRNMFHYEYKKVLEEQIVFALKKGVHSIDKLNDLCNTNLDNPNEYFMSFNEILMKVARKSTKDDDIQNENNNNESDDTNNTNITLQSLANNMNPSDDDDDDDDDDKDVDNGNKPNINSLRNNKNRKDKKDTKKENQNSYIKPVNFYLKDDVECNAISAVNRIDDQRSYLNIEISKNATKLLKIQDFESEETYFFNSNQELNIRLKQFLQTPTIIAIVYDTLRSSSEIDPLKAELNDHLAMNILILISRFIKEEPNVHSKTELKSQTKIQYNSLPDFISKLKRFVFNYRTSGKDIDEKAFIDNTLNPANFISLLKMKFNPKNLQPKSFIDILMNKGQLGQDVLHQISSNIHIDDLDALNKKENDIKAEEQDLKALQKKKANKLKEDIMNQYSNIRNHYHFSDSISDSFSLSSSGFFSPNKEVCTLCSETKKNEILCYPLYIYRTKFPFIVDKPPLVNSEEVKDIAVYDNEDDFDKDTDIVEYLRNELGIVGEQSDEELYKLTKFKRIITSIFDQQKKEKEDLKIGNEKMKRVTLGANFIVQYGICPHPVHRSCVVDEENFVCPIDRSTKNGFLPYLDYIPMHVIFKNTKTFELSSSCENDDSLQSNLINSISSFIDKFRSFFDCLKDDSLNVFIELIKSISGLIETYEIRVRNLPDSLDSTKTKILARNLFLTVWYAYRIQKKPKLTMISKTDSKEIDTDSRLTDFQKFIKILIEFDDLDNPDIETELKKMIDSMTSAMISSPSSEEKNLKTKEKEVCLFLRRACLAEFFLLDVNVNIDEQEILDWDNVLSTENLSQRYDFKFTSIDVTQNEEFEFKPFIFTRFPKEFLRLSQTPYNLPISEVCKISMFNILDYNYLIKYYNDFDDTTEEDNSKEIYKPKSSNNNSNDSNNNDSNNNDSNNNDNNNDNNNNDNNNSDNNNNDNNNSDNNNNDNNNSDNNNNNNSNDNNNNNNNDNNNNNNDNNNNNSNDNNNNNNNDEDDEVKRYRRAVHVCDDEFLPFFMTFYGKLHYPSILMFTGALSPQIFLVDQFRGAALETPYVDKSGCPDINHVRMQPLFLNEERYEKLIDQILSGDFSYNLSSLEKKKDLFSQEIESSDLF